MKMTAKDTNVIVLFGDGAVAGFPEMVRCWSRMLTPSSWGRFQFILVGSEPPAAEELDTIDNSLVNDRNTRFYTFEDKAPGTSAYHNIIFDKIETGTVWLHAVCDTAQKETDFSWLESLIGAAENAESLTTHCLFYLLFGMNSPASEQEQMIRLVDGRVNSCYLLGDTNENGGRVTNEERWHAASLGVLMNCCGNLQVVQGVYSFGYSALNANGSELRRLCESAGCRALLEELTRPIDTLNAVADQLDLLPEGVSSPSDFHDWLTKYSAANAPQPTAAARKNAWITIRMNSDLSPSEAVRRMQRFVDLNYTGQRNVGEAAKELAWTTERAVLRRMCASPLTAGLSDNVLEEIAEAFRRMTTGDVQPGGCVYPKKPFMMKLGKGAEEYERQCRDAVSKSMRNYMTQKNVGVFAAEMEAAYRRLAAWLRKAQGKEEYLSPNAQDLLREIQKELDSSDAGDAARLAQKYKRYAGELEAMHPALSILMEGMTGNYFDEKGNRLSKNWSELVKQAGLNLEKRMPAVYRGRFFRVLTAEFATEEERANFFEEYLSDGPRMYRNFQAAASAGTHVLLADDSLTDQWFMNQTIYTVKTDNAENLTVYPLGTESAAFYLQDPRIYFHGTSTGAAGGKGLFSGIRPERPAEAPEENRRRLFGGGSGSSEGRHEKAPEAKPLGTCGLRMMPDKEDHYKLYWEWRGKDETAMVEITQYGEKVGKIAVIPILKFKANGDCMDVTDDVMGGKPLPAGTLTVTVRDVNHNVYIDSVDLPGRRDVVRYKVGGNRLEVKRGNGAAMKKLVLRTTDINGAMTYFPLYPADNDRPWVFEGLVLSDGCLVEDPTQESGLIIPIDEGI